MDLATRAELLDRVKVAHQRAMLWQQAGTAGIDDADTMTLGEWPWPCF